MATGRPTVAVTGSTGAVGGTVAGLLAERGIPQRLLVRSPHRAPDLPLSEVVTTSYGSPDVVAALDGVDVLFMVSGSESADRLEQHRSFVDAAREAGVGHVVYTSFFGAAPDATFTLARDHAATEHMIRDAGLGHTFLRDNLYLDFFPQLVGDDGVIRGPAGTGRVSAVARADIARAAAAVVTDPAAHADRTYDLTGREALSLGQVAEVLSRHLGRDVVFHDESVDEAYASRRAYGAPDWQLDAWVSTYTAIASGELEPVSDDVERLTGRPPLSLQELLEGARP